jgi:predicted nucleic acid-binding Zn ribbon protein
MTDLMTYEAALNGEGYEWVEPTDRKGYVRRIRSAWNPAGEQTPRLVLVPKRPELMNRRTVRPTDQDAALFRNFAAMEPTPNQILDFVHRYGPLWGAERERFEEWEFEIRTMRFLIELWDAVQAGKRTGIIEEHFKADKAGVVEFPFVDSVLEYKSWLSQRPKAAEHSGSPFTVETRDTAVAQRGTPLKAAQSYVVQAINIRLSMLGAQTMLDWPNAKYQLVTRPHNLLGALWFQFASSIAGKKTYRACDVCGRAMEMSPDVNRADRRYCSDACRSRALRARQKQAAEMRTSGKTLREIAKATGSDMATIKKWLGED